MDFGTGRGGVALTTPYRVVMVGPAHGGRDGIGKFSAGLAKELISAGCDVACVNVTAVAIIGPADLGDLASGGAKELRDRVIGFGADLVHVQFAIAAFGTTVLRLVRFLAALQRSSVPIVVTAHEVTRDRARAGLIAALVYRRIAKSASAIIVHTEAARREVIALAPGADVRLMRLPTAERPPVGRTPARLRRDFAVGDRKLLLAFGFIHPHKGQLDLITALGRARVRSGSSLDAFTVVVAGGVRRRVGFFRIMEVPDWWYYGRLRLAVRRLGLERSAIFTGYVEDGDVAGWFEVAYAAVLPYRKIEQSAVLSLVRAFQTPMIASDAGGLAEELSGDWIFPAGDRDKLSELLIRLSAEQPTGTSGWENAWSVARLAQETQALYADALTKSGARVGSKDKRR